MVHDTNRRGVVICGAYGMDNAGDDAVLTAIAASLRNIDPSMPITVMARKPRETEKHFGVRAIHPLRPDRWLPAMAKARLFISGGGSLLQDVTSYRSLLYYLSAIRLAKRLGCRVMLYGCGIGPLKRPGARRQTAKALNACADAITLRDSGSLETLKNLGVAVEPLLLSADPVRQAQE